MKRIYKSIIAAGLCLSMFCGCQKTPEDSIVKEKGAVNIKEYESARPEEGSLQDIVSAPKHYTNKAKYEEGALVIDTDAEVILPQADSMNTYRVSAKKADQEMIDTVTQAFFEGAKFYSSYNYGQWTKQQYQEDIARLKKYKAEGNLDPYDYGKDENGNIQFQIDDVIARDEEEMKNAPDEIIKEEVHPSFGLEHWSGKGDEMTKEVDENDFFGVAELGEKSYDYHITKGLAPDITFQIQRIREDGIDLREYSGWLEGEYVVKREGENSNNSIPEKTAKQFIKISLEDAEKIAREKVEKLGWDMDVYGWDYALYYHGEQGIKEDNVLDGGYLFHFARILEGAPITYTASYGGGLEDMDSTLTPWSYERCNIIVSKDGVEKVEICNPYEIGEIQTEHIKLMDFESIIKIYEQMMEVSNADIVTYEDQRTFHVRKITLGYGRIYDPTSSSDSGLIVPVWDFFGGFDVDGKDYSVRDSGENSTESYLTINAIDGTVIDREIGY